MYWLSKAYYFILKWCTNLSFKSSIKLSSLFFASVTLEFYYAIDYLGTLAVESTLYFYILFDPLSLFWLYYVVRINLIKFLGVVLELILCILSYWLNKIIILCETKILLDDKIY